MVILSFHLPRAHGDPEHGVPQRHPITTLEIGETRGLLGGLCCSPLDPKP